MNRFIPFAILLSLSLCACQPRAALPEIIHTPSPSSSISENPPTSSIQLSEVPPRILHPANPPIIEKPRQQPDETWMLLLANKTHPVGEYSPELEQVQSIYQMDVRMAKVTRNMLADAQSQGIDLLVCSAYRPYSSQERNYNNNIARLESAGYSKKDAIYFTEQVIAPPGTSEHQTGLAADIVTPAYQSLDSGFAATDAAKWLAKNAPDYGFILRYPADKTEITGYAYEPWHFRYVGVEPAKEITKRGICLEEYLSETEKAHG